MDIEAIQKSYRRYAASYDVCFGAVFQPGRRAVIERLSCRPGDRVLEVGVGTGLSLPMYPKSVHVTGIDLSTDMLERARRRRTRMKLPNVDLFEMDAEDMRFEDSSFDKVVAMYVASVVPHPDRLVEEMRRVCKPDGELFIVNHFRSQHSMLATGERLLAPLSKALGFRPDFDLEQFLADTNLDVVEREPVNFMGYWTFLRARNNKRPQAGAIPPTAELQPSAAMSR